MKRVETGHYRSKPLFYGDIRGKFVVSDHVIHQTILSLRESSNLEALVFWAGHQVGEFTFISSLVLPPTEQGALSVFVSEKNCGIASRAARQCNVCILAQVHSHPGRISWHSDGDDDLILFQYDGVLSLVVPEYARQAESLEDFSVHQLQDGQWILGTGSSIKENIKVATSTIDCRGEPHGTRK